MIFTGVRICTSKSLHQWKATLKMIQKIFQHVIGMPRDRSLKASPLKTLACKRNYMSQSSVITTLCMIYKWKPAINKLFFLNNLYRILVGKPEGKRPMERPRCRWEDNIKMNLQEVGCGVWTVSSWLRIGTGGRHL
jgi:hypothetical protein